MRFALVIQPYTIDEALYASGITVSPMVYMVLCVRFTFAVASIGTTLGMGGWLGLAQRGLAPCKKYQALLGALTVCICDIVEPTTSAHGCEPANPWEDALLYDEILKTLAII